MFVRIATAAAAAAAITLAAVAGTTATAGATVIDEQFLSKIDQAGITFASNQAAFDDASMVCRELASGKTGVQVAREILDSTNLTSHQAAVFVVESASAYCPGYTDRLTA